MEHDLFFVDDATRKTWIFLVKKKYDVFEYFKQFHWMVKREASTKLKCFGLMMKGSFEVTNSNGIAWSWVSGKWQ